MLARVVCVLLVLAAVSEAALIQTYYSAPGAAPGAAVAAPCASTPTMTFNVSGHHHCQIFDAQDGVKVSDVSLNTRVSFHDQPFCEASSQVAQIFGGGCVVYTHPLRAVWID